MSAGNLVLSEHPQSAFNAFLMMRFTNDSSNVTIREAIRSAFARYAINVLRADDKAFHDSLWSNVKAYMDACDLGVAVFEHGQSVEFNPNVSLELGYMLALQRKVPLLKERNIPRLPSDMLGHLYQEFDNREISSTIESAVHTWLRDIGVAKAKHEKLVVFVSYGGTCRCAMSKIVARRAFAGRSLPWSLRFESMASVFGNRTCASDGARDAVREAFGQDYLASHKVMSKNAGIIDDADLILVMGTDLAKGLPQHKTVVITEFFGKSGRVQNPWPDTDSGASERYRSCLAQLRELIEPNSETLIRALSV